MEVDMHHGLMVDFTYLWLLVQALAYCIVRPIRLDITTNKGEYFMDNKKIIKRLLFLILFLMMLWGFYDGKTDKKESVTQNIEESI